MHVKLNHEGLIDDAAHIPPRFRGMVKELLWKIITQRTKKDVEYKVCRNVIDYIQVRKQWFTSEEQTVIEARFDNMLKLAMEHQATDKPSSELWITDDIHSNEECILQTQSNSGSWESCVLSNAMVKDAAKSGGYDSGMATWTAIWSSGKLVLHEETRPLHFMEDYYRERIKDPMAVKDSMLTLKKYALDLPSPLRLTVVQRDKAKKRDEMVDVVSQA